MSDNKTIQEIADEYVANAMAEYEAEKTRQAGPPTVEQQLAQAQFRELVAEHALLHGVRPQSVRHVVRDAEAVFELRDGRLVARDGQTDPGDPLGPLTPACWMQQLAKTDGYLFAAPDTERT